MAQNDDTVFRTCSLTNPAKRVATLTKNVREKSKGSFKRRFSKPVRDLNFVQSFVPDPRSTWYLLQT